MDIAKGREEFYLKAAAQKPYLRIATARNALVHNLGVAEAENRYVVHLSVFEVWILGGAAANSSVIILYLKQ